MTTPPEDRSLYGPAPYGQRARPAAEPGATSAPPPDQPRHDEVSAAPTPVAQAYGPQPGQGHPGYPPAPGYQQPGYPPPPGYHLDWPAPSQGHPAAHGGGHPAGYVAGPPPAFSPVPPRPSFPHPEPRPYHLMLRTWDYAWWRPVVGLVALLAGMLVVLPAIALPVLLVAAAVDGGGAEIANAFNGLMGGELSPSGLLYLNLTLAGLILWTWLLIRVLHSMRPRWLSSVRPKLRWKYLLACLGLAVVALVAQVVVGSLVPGDVPGTEAADPNPLDGRTIALLVIVLLTTPLQAAGEEYAFRGYLLQALGALLGHKWVTIVLTALLFAVAHLQFDPPLFIDRFLFGLVAAWLVIRTGGLEAGIALHVLNNYLALGFAILFSDLTEALDPGNVSWWHVPVSLTQSLVYAGLAAYVAHRMGLQTRTRPPAEEPADVPTGAGTADGGVSLEKVG